MECSNFQLRGVQCYSEYVRILMQSSLLVSKAEGVVCDTILTGNIATFITFKLYTCTHVLAQNLIQTCAHIHIHAHIHTYTCTRAHKYKHVHTSIYTHAYAGKYSHTCTHACMCMPSADSDIIFTCSVNLLPPQDLTQVEEMYYQPCRSTIYLMDRMDMSSACHKMSPHLPTAYHSHPVSWMSLR